MATLPNQLGEPALVQSLRFGFDPEDFFAGARRTSLCIHGGTLPRKTPGGGR
jgi:hypothetical protein